MDKVLAEKPQVRRIDHRGKNVAEYFYDKVVYQGSRFSVFLKLLKTWEVQVEKA